MYYCQHGFNICPHTLRGSISLWFNKQQHSFTQNGGLYIGERHVFVMHYTLRPLFFCSFCDIAPDISYGQFVWVITIILMLIIYSSNDSSNDNNILDNMTINNNNNQLGRAAPGPPAACLCLACASKTSGPEVCACIYIYIYIHTCTYIHIYTV